MMDNLININNIFIIYGKSRHCSRQLEINGECRKIRKKISDVKNFIKDNAQIFKSDVKARLYWRI